MRTPRLPLTLALTFLGTFVPPGFAALRADTERLHAPPVRAENLGSGRGAPGQLSRVSIDVVPPEPGRGWVLTVRSGLPAAAASGEPPRIRWKLGSEPTGPSASFYCSSTAFRTAWNEPARRRTR